MPHIMDRDGKSKTASAVDELHYPEVETAPKIDVAPREPSHEDIAQRAHDLWLSHGCPEGTAEQDWLEAERQLHVELSSQSAIQSVYDKAGSVQA